MDAPVSILVVDDEPTIRFYLEKVLRRDGYEVQAVESGEAALECLATHEFDLALIDLKLKGIGGMEVLAELRRRWPATTVIVLTAHASLETAVEALRQGAHDYLFKPFATVDLRESVRTGLLKHEQELQRLAYLGQSQEAHITKSEPGASDVGSVPRAAPASSVEPSGRFLQYMGLIVDPIRHVVTVDGNLLELSPTEFGLLAYLVGEAPRVVSAQELIREVQGYENESWEARDSVRTHIYNIRQKIKTATGRSLIRTVRGIGYALDQ